MSKAEKQKEVVIKCFNIRFGVEEAEKQANEIIEQGYELFSTAVAGSSVLGASTENMNRLILVFKKKKE